jgi:3-deoxy-D-manno-oct-2-ulosonic acid (Kdo) hydroxylase
MPNSPWIQVEDYKAPGGWVSTEQRDERSRAYCEMLERGEILFFRELPFLLPIEDQKFLREQEWTELRMHKNVSYRPSEDVLRGVSGNPATVERLRKIFQTYTAQVIAFAGKFLSPYKDKWVLDFASFRPLEEEGRDLPLHKRNDLLHVDAFPSRPTRGGRIMRIFTNLNPARPRVWNTTENFSAIAQKFAERAGLKEIAQDDSTISRAVHNLGAKLGLTTAVRTPYDMFMLRFHDYLKENADFQKNTPKQQIDFPPLATWIVFTDCVAHAVMSGQYAIEQTFLIPPAALVTREAAPYRILENIAGRSLIA